MCGKLASVCGVISKVRYVLDRNSLLMIYHSLIESRLRYGILGWSTASNQQIRRLKVLQNRALRFIDFSPIATTILPIYRQFNVLPLANLIDLARANYMYLFSINQLPVAFRSYCLRPSHQYETRFSRNNFSLGRQNSKLSETSMKVIGPKIWTNIPSEAKILPFRKTFSKHMKQFYLDKLPTLKRTKQLSLNESNTKFKELQAIFDDEEDNTTFYGFYIELEISIESTSTDIPL